VIQKTRAKSDLLIATFGPPGSGKSTVCGSLANMLEAEIISPGRELRRLSARGGHVGEEAKRLIHMAAPAPDIMLWWMLTEHGSGALILDGVPQNIRQVSLLADFASQFYYHLVGVHLLVSREIALNRILNRWYCTQCRQSFSNGEAGCDCGARLYQRLDDTMATTVSARLDRYERDVTPAAAKFSAQFRYQEFDASNDPKNLLMRVRGWIKSLYDI